MKNVLLSVLLAAIGAGSTTGLSQAAATMPPATALPAEVQAALDRARAAIINQPAAGRGATVQATMPNLLATSTVAADATVGLMALNESRSATGTGLINLSLALTGGNFPAGSSVRRTTVTVAQDDKDRSLISNNARGAVANNAVGGLLTANSRLLALARGGAAATQPLSGSATLAVSRRDASAIRVLEGEVEVFVPSAAGAVLTIKDVLNQAGKALDDPVLRQEGIEIIVVTAATFGTVRDRVMNPAAAATGIVQPDPSFANGPAVYVRDPAGKLAAFVFEDEVGNTLPGAGAGTRSTPDGGALFELRFPAGLPAGARLRLLVAVPEATRVIPFRFENVALP